MPNPTRPVSYPVWTSGPSSTVVQPTTALSNTGYAEGIAPAAENVNWMLWDINAWIEWFDFSGFNANLQATETSNFTTAFPVRTYLCNTTSGGFTATLEDAATAGAGRQIILKNIGLGTSNNVSIARSGSDQIEGGTSDTLTPGDVRTYESDGVSNWWNVSP